MVNYLYKKNKYTIKNKYKNSKTKKKFYKSIKCVKTNKHIMLGGSGNNVSALFNSNNDFFRKIFLYVNEELGIQIYTSGQLKINKIKPHLFTMWFELLKKYNIKLYITFNDNDKAYLYHTEKQKQEELKNKNTEDYSKETQLEKTIFEETCVKDKEYKCKFVSIEVIDYTTPTLTNLITFWKELDEFYKFKIAKDDTSSNVLMHCTSGIGRTGFMLCSYIWLKKLEKEEKEEKEEHKIITISTANIKTLLSNKAAILLKDDNNEIHNLYKLLKQEHAIEFLKDEMQKFNLDFITELFNLYYYKSYEDITLIEMMNVKKNKKHRKDVILFINRIAIFIEAYEAYDEHRKQTL